MDTPLVRGTSISSTGVEVLTESLSGANTYTTLADIGTGTIIAIVARGLVVCVFAAGGGVTQVVGTAVVIIAIENLSAGAQA
jgi:hypothetical protein